MKNLTLIGELLTYMERPENFKIIFEKKKGKISSLYFI
jgi:hypothetical protein